MKKNNNDNLINNDLSDWMKKVNKSFGMDVIQLGIKEEPLELIPFSSLRLTYLSYGGVPRGRMIEVYGEESSGKSTLCLDLMFNFQKLYPNELILYADVEGTYDAVWASNMGVDSSKVVYLNCVGQYAEQIFDTIKSAMETGQIGMVIVDSIGAMYSKQASEKSFEERTYGGIALPMTAFVNQSIPIVNRHKICFIGINQIRANIGNMYQPITTPGGKAWQFAVSQRYMTRKGRFLDKNGNELTGGAENPAGHLIEVKLIKSKTCASDRRVGKCSLYYLTGIQVDADLLALALKFKIIQLKGAFHKYKDNTGKEYSIQGKSKMLKELNSNKLLWDELSEKVNKLLITKEEELSNEELEDMGDDD